VDERRFARSFDSLEGLHAFIAEFLTSERLDAAHAFDLDLIAEELFTNMVKYGGGREAIAVGLAREGDTVTLVLRDFDGHPYDVTNPRGVAVDAPLEARRPGGLGLHLVQRMADDLDYCHDGRTGTITVRKRLGS